MFCMKCGTPLPDDAMFCFKCGTQTGATAQMGAVQAPQQAISLKEAAVLYSKGFAFSKANQDDKAFECYLKAAEVGYVAAQASLGYCYHYGKGVPQNYAKAAECYRKVADKEGFKNIQEILDKLKAEGKI